MRETMLSCTVFVHFSLMTISICMLHPIISLIYRRYWAFSEQPYHTHSLTTLKFTSFITHTTGLSLCYIVSYHIMSCITEAIPQLDYCYLYCYNLHVTFLELCYTLFGMLKSVTRNTSVTRLCRPTHYSKVDKQMNRQMDRQLETKQKLKRVKGQHYAEITLGNTSLRLLS